MKNLVATFFALILFVAATTLTAQNETKYDNALLWKVSGNGLSKPSYILGTHHLAHVSYVDSIPGLRSAMETTEQTVKTKPVTCPTCERTYDTPIELKYIGTTSICNECYQIHLRFINEQCVIRPAKKSTPSKKTSTQNSNYDYTNTSYSNVSANTSNDDDDRHRSNVSESSSSYDNRSDSSSDYSGGGGDSGGGGSGGDW